MKKILSFAIPVLFCLGIGVAGRYVQAEAQAEWYPFLSKPALTPPGWAFPVVWTFIYVCMGVACGFVWNMSEALRRRLLALWIVQLVLNFLWSVLFFYCHSFSLGMLDILLLDVSVFCFMWTGFKVKSVLGWLFVPYMVWLLLATYLNGSLWYLNA